MTGLKPDDIMAVSLQASKPTDLLKGYIDEGLAGGGKDGCDVGGTGKFEDGLTLNCIELLGDGDVIHLLCRCIDGERERERDDVKYRNTYPIS